MSDSGDEKYWFNTKTKQVEKGPKSTWEHRMGPYDTEAEAASALSTAADRNDDWEAEDREWDR